MQRKIITMTAQCFIGRKALFLYGFVAVLASQQTSQIEKADINSYITPGEIRML